MERIRRAAFTPALTSLSKQRKRDLQPVTVKLAGREEFDAWDAYCAGKQEAGVFHLAGWLDVLASAFDVHPLPLIACKSGRICGVLPAYISRGFPFAAEVASMPGGLIADDPAAANALLTEMKSRAATVGVRQLRLRGEFVGLADKPTTIMRRVHTVINLQQGTDALWQMYSSNHRRKIRKAQKSGFRAELSDKIPDAFHSLYCDNQHRLGTPVVGKRFFDAMNRRLGENIHFAGLWLEKELVAGAILANVQSRWESLYVASRRSVLKNYATYGLYWQMIVAASANGAVELDLGRSVPGSGNHAFKQQWGGEDREIHDLIWRLDHDERIGSSGGTTARENILSAIWKRLPRGIADRLGPWLRRSKPFG